MSPEEFDRQIKQIDAEGRSSAMRSLIIGNLQVDNVVPEVKHNDLELQFDTDLFFSRVEWAKANPKIYLNIRNWSHELGLYLVGGTGCGKTTFFKAKAIALSQQQPFNSNFVKFVNIGKLCDGCSANNWIAKNTIINDVLRCQHLFIDDVGTESGHAWELSLLHNIMDGRLHSVDRSGNRRQTYISSNYKLDDLPYHERLLRRIKESVIEMIVWKIDEKTQRKIPAMEMSEAQKGF